VRESREYREKMERMENGTPSNANKVRDSSQIINSQKDEEMKNTS